MDSKIGAKIIAAGLIGALSTFGLAACSSEGQDQSAQSQSDENQLTFAIGEPAGEFDPKKGWGDHGQHRLLHSALLKFQDGVELEGDLAKSFEESEDGKQWTFELNPDFKFSDGVQVTAEDVKFTYDMLKEDGTAWDMSSLESVEADGDNKVTINLKQPDTIFPALLTQIGIVPKDKYDDNYSQDPIGSGPYKVTEFRPGEQLILERNEHYPTKPKHEKLVFMLSDEDQSIQAAKAGDVDVLAVFPGNSNQDIKGMKDVPLQTVEAMGMTMPTVPSGGKGKTNGEEVEVGNDVTADKAIRQALTLGIDREALVDLTLDGRGRPAYSSVDGQPWFNTDTIFEDHKVDDAKKLLEEAGWKDSNGDGIVDKDGTEASFELYYPSNDSNRGDLSNAVAAQAKEIGIEIKPKGVTWDDIYKDGKTVPVMFGLGAHVPSDLYFYYASDQIGVSYHNLSSYKNSVVDEHLKKAREATSLEESLDEWKAAQWDGKTGMSSRPDADNPFIWLVNRDHVYYVKDGLSLGKQPIHAHGHGWQIFLNWEEWV